MMSYIILLSLLLLSTIVHSTNDRIFYPEFVYHLKQATTVSRKLAISNAEFALNLLRLTRDSDESMIISPYSISLALGLLDNGAEGNTQRQISNAFASGITILEVNKRFARIFRELEGNNGNQAYTINVANKLYLQEGSKIQQRFLNTVSASYDGQFEEINFSDSNAAATKMNTWVSQMTNDKIKDLIKADSVSPETKMIILNAVYFKGIWKQAFEQNATRKAPFLTSENKKVMIDTMHTSGTFGYGYYQDMRVLSLGYQGSDDIKMLIILPTRRNCLKSLLQTLTGSRLLDVIDVLEETDVDLVRLPKFTLNVRSNMVNKLKSLGVTDAFGENADFSGISKTKLFVKQFTHQAFIEVNEQGTEAAVASAVGISNRSGSGLNFIVDHPFMFAIVRNNRDLLFTGQFNKP